MTQTDNGGLKRFASLVAAFGARPEAWPEADRAWARRLTETSPEARRLAAEAAEVDCWLDGLVVPPLRAGLEARILANAPVRSVPTGERPGHFAAMAGALERLRARLGALLPAAPVMRPVYATACAALFGLVLGWGGVFTPSAGEEEEILAIAFIGGELEQFDLGE